MRSTDSPGSPPQRQLCPKCQRKTLSLNEPALGDFRSSLPASFSTSPPPVKEIRVLRISHFPRTAWAQTDPPDSFHAKYSWPCGPKGWSLQVSCQSCRKTCMILFSQREKEKEAPTNIQERQRVGMTKKGKLKFTGHFPDVQFCAKTVTAYWQCSPRSHFTNKEPEAQKWNSREPGWISKSDPSCIDTRVPKPSLDLPHHGIHTKGNLAKFNEILKKTS